MQVSQTCVEVGFKKLLLSKEIEVNEEIYIKKLKLICK